MTKVTGLSDLGKYAGVGASVFIGSSMRIIIFEPAFVGIRPKPESTMHASYVLFVPSEVHEP